MVARSIPGKPYRLAKPARGRNVYLLEETDDWLTAKAAREQISVSSMIRVLLLEAQRMEKANA